MGSFLDFYLSDPFTFFFTTVCFIFYGLFIVSLLRKP